MQLFDDCTYCGGYECTRLAVMAFGASTMASVQLCWRPNAQFWVPFCSCYVLSCCKFVSVSFPTPRAVSYATPHVTWIFDTALCNGFGFYSVGSQFENRPLFWQVWRSFRQYLQENARMTHRRTSQSLPFRYLPVHYLTVIPPFDSVRSEWRIHRTSMILCYALISVVTVTVSVDCRWYIL